MTTFIIFYYIFSYLFMYGATFNDKNWWDLKGTIIFLLSPIWFPITLGIALMYEK